MKFSLATVFLCLFFAAPALAYNSYVTEVREPYETIPMEQELQEKQVYLGVLEGFPVMYEVQVNATTSLFAQVSQRYQSGIAPRELALMVVRDDEGGGVTEVGRLRPKSDAWTTHKDSTFGMTFSESEAIQKEISPGVYRIEVSTPTNEGPYLLTLGENDVPLGYFKTLSQVRATQKVFGFSVFNMLRSSYVYYPLGIVLILFVIHRTWKFRKSISHA